MIANLLVSLPVGIWVPDDVALAPQSYEDEGFRVILRSLCQSDRPPAPDLPDLCKVNGVTASYADLLMIDFQKDSMERRQGAELDPPLPIISHAVNSFLTRFRHISQYPEVRPVDITKVSWLIHYRNDDGSDISVEAGKVRKRWSRPYDVSLVWLDQKRWDDILELDPVYEPPAWETLLLDARSELPKIGPAIVLAATALEVFISKILDELVALKNVPPDLWRWINERKDPDCLPKVGEQFDDLLRYVTGHSLKEEPKLWEFFLQLKKARNDFVHEGVARIGREPVDAKRADLLILAAKNIIGRVRDWLPIELQWQEHEREFGIHMEKNSPQFRIKEIPDEPVKEAEAAIQLSNKTSKQGPEDQHE